VVNARVEMPRTSCHLSIFSLGKLGGFQLGLVDGMTGDRPVLTDHAAAGSPGKKGKKVTHKNY